jgi:hypothetical protein
MADENVPSRFAADELLVPDALPHHATAAFAFAFTAGSSIALAALISMINFSRGLAPLESCGNPARSTVCSGYSGFDGVGRLLVKKTRNPLFPVGFG